MTVAMPSAADAAVSTGLVIRSGPTSVRVDAPAFVDGYNTIMAAQSTASAALRLAMTMRALHNTPERQEFQKKYRGLAIQYWLEPAKTPEWLKDPPAPPKREKYWGAN